MSAGPWVSCPSNLPSLPPALKSWEGLPAFLSLFRSYPDCLGRGGSYPLPETRAEAMHVPGSHPPTHPTPGLVGRPWLSGRGPVCIYSGRRRAGVRRRVGVGGVRPEVTQDAAFKNLVEPLPQCLVLPACGWPDGLEGRWAQADSSRAGKCPGRRGQQEPGRVGRLAWGRSVPAWSRLGRSLLCCLSITVDVSRGTGLPQGHPGPTGSVSCARVGGTVVAAQLQASD